MSDDSQITLIADNLQADITGFLVDHLRHQECAYRWLPAEQQEEVIDKAKRAARELILEVVRTVVAKDRDVIPATLAQMTNDGKVIGGKITVPKTSEQRHALLDAVGSTVYLTVEEPEDYMADAADLPQPDPNQRDMYDGRKAAE